MTVTFNMKVVLRWWFDNISFKKRVIDDGNPDVSINTDSSLLGWGAIMIRLKFKVDVIKKNKICTLIF